MQSELIVLSHLRWSWVWQRPQHLISRIGRGRKVWFVEEPATPEKPVILEPRLVGEEVDGMTIVRLEVPDPGRHVGFDENIVPHYVEELPRLVGSTEGERIVWLYSPLALEIALALEPTVLVYDVMDDLGSFKNAAPELMVRQRQTLRQADVVFAGGRSLHRAVVAQGREDVHLFPSGVEPEHYATARSFDSKADRPVAGYVGVIDERLDLDLIRDLASELPDWEIRLVGPVAKIAIEDLPDGPNITYLGPKPYEELPEVMAGFDVALMPFAINEATRSISPTKTLEYLAAGLPVVSTRVADVVTDFGTCVDLQDDARGFAAACARVRGHDLTERDQKLRPLLYQHHWDTIAHRMTAMIDAAATRAAIETEEVSA